MANTVTGGHVCLALQEKILWYLRIPQLLWIKRKVTTAAWTETSKCIGHQTQGSNKTHANCIGALLINHNHINVRKKRWNKRHLDRQTPNHWSILNTMDTDSVINNDDGYLQNGRHLDHRPRALHEVGQIDGLQRRQLLNTCPQIAAKQPRH